MTWNSRNWTRNSELFNAVDYWFDDEILYVKKFLEKHFVQMCVITDIHK